MGGEHRVLDPLELEAQAILNQLHGFQELNSGLRQKQQGLSTCGHLFPLKMACLRLPLAVKMGNNAPL